MRLEIVVIRYTLGVFNILVSQRVLVEKVIFGVNRRFMRARCHEPDKEPPKDKDCGDRECTPLQDFKKDFHSLAPMNESDVPSFVMTFTTPDAKSSHGLSHVIKCGRLTV